MTFATLLASCILGMDVSGAEDTADFAHVSQWESWLRHPVYGDASFDAFEHAAGNPVHRGAAPYEWPVNGFLFEDPVSGDWFLYVGHYCTGYAFKEEAPSKCTVFRSRDHGVSWEHQGPVFDPEPHVFEGETSPVDHAPDVSVLYDGGRYHLCFDWCTATTTWANAANPPPDANSGAGYAWAERPEGPFHITARPLATTRDQEPLLGKYRRLYASTIIRRAQDWLVLTLTDSGQYFGWALLGMTAAAPEGPYTKPLLLLHPESHRYHPPLLEFFPAFVHEGFIYAPATSVAMNRNYQALFRVPVEDAMRPEAWQLHQAGSVWHAEPVENESHGIWGQTFSGFVARDGIFHVMFPSRDENGNGTINIAARPWAQPLRERGFVVSGHESPSLVLLRRAGPARSLETALQVRGTAVIVWNAAMPLGPNLARSNATLHPLMTTRFDGLELGPGAWTIVAYNDHGKRSVIAEGTRGPDPSVHLKIAWEADTAQLEIDGVAAWSGALAQGPGAFGIYAGKHSHIRADQFLLTGVSGMPRLTYLYTEALLSAAQSLEHWEEVSDARFRYGAGAVSKADTARAKWNFEGTAVTLYAPRGPDYGAAQLFVDGAPAATVDFRAGAPAASQPLFVRADLAEGRHTLVLEARQGRFPLDCIEVE